MLFVGNSLTASHDLPGRVAALARSDEAMELIVEAVTIGGASLEDHWRGGTALAAIERGGWDVVVLQQGPSSTPANRLHLLEWSRRFAERIRAVGAEPALYMVWQPRGGDFDAVIRSYAEAAAAVDGILLPAGAAWQAVLRRHPQIGLYGTDEFHPSPAGSHLAALVIYGRLTGRSVLGRSAALPRPGLPAADARILERAADEANAPPAD